MTKFILSHFLICLSFCGNGQHEIDDATPSLNRIDSITIGDVPRQSPGIASAIVSGSKTVYERYYGYADLKDSVKISPNSRFNIASNGKQFTALAILLLESEGRLTLKDDIR